MDVKLNRPIRGTANWDKPINENFELIEEHLQETKSNLEIANRIYEGVNLSEKFSGEISSFSSVWAWIQNRIHMGNFAGINVGDFIQFTAGGNIVVAEVAGINTYRDYGDTAVPNHIDFISRDCWPEPRVWNRVNYNNGIVDMPQPFLASDIFAWLNGLQTQVPNDATTAMTQSPAPTGSLIKVDYRTTGLLPQLPAQLRTVIVQKRAMMPRRYSADVLLVDNNSWDFRDIGFLWLPSEMEVFGTNVWGSIFSPNQGWSVGGYRKYPIFDLTGKLRKGAGHNGTRSNWWFSTPRGSHTATIARVSSHGIASFNNAAVTSVHVPICFRIA